jgi:hypothetical protein
MEDQESMRGDGSSVEKEEKGRTKRIHNMGLGACYSKKNHQRLKNSHNAITYNTHATTRSL